MSDLIRREDAIDYFVTNIGVVDADGYAVDDYDERVKIWTERFCGIPSAEPEERTAKVVEEDNESRYCFACKEPIIFLDDVYCSHCGAKLDWSER